MENKQLSYGNQDAPVKVEVFLNLACPYCATYFAAAEEVLPEYIESGKVEYIIKHYDKPREMLLIGTLANSFLDYKNPDKVREIMKDLFETQDIWDKLHNHDIKKLLAEKYQLQEEPDNIDIGLSVIDEAIRRHVKMVPTVFINGKEFQYPREIDAQELRSEIDAALAN
jgi:protein-disulfide isomerase